jgi:type II secretory pathway component PulK
LQRIERTDLGRGSWCSATAVDPGERVNPNRVDSLALVRALGDVGRASSVLDWIDADDLPRGAGAESAWYRAEGRPQPRNGPMTDPAELGLVRGMEGIPPERLDLVFTTRGDGRIDPNRAPIEVLRAITSLPIDAAIRVDGARRNGVRIDDAEELVTAAGARIDAAGFRSLVTQTVFEDQDRVVRVVAGAASGDRTVTSMFTATLRASPRGGSVIRIEVGR